MHRLAKRLLKTIDATYADNCGIQSMGADGTMIKSDNYIMGRWAAVSSSSLRKLPLRSSRYIIIYKRSLSQYITLFLCFLIPTKLSFFLLPVFFLFLFLFFLRDMFI